MSTIEIDAPDIGSQLRKFVADRVKESDGWQAMDSFLKEIGGIEAHLSQRRRLLDELEREADNLRGQIKDARRDGEEAVADAANEAARIKQQASEMMAAAEKAKAEAAEIVGRARAEARHIIQDAEQQVSRALAGLKS